MAEFPAPTRADTGTSWLLRPITRQDISDAISRYAPGLPPTEFSAFLDSIAETWEGVPWGEAGPWDMAVEWRRFVGEA